MNEEKSLTLVDGLLEDAFAPKGGEAPQSFECGVMARITGLQRGESFWDVLRAVARPLLVSGWAAAALLGLVAWRGLDHGREVAMAAVMNADAVSRWLAL